MAKTKVLVLFGGAPTEYQKSLQSAADVLRTIPEEKYEVIPLGRNLKGRWLYFPGDYSEIADGTWDQNPDCSPTVLSPDAAHHGILILEDSGYTHKRIDVVFSLMPGRYGEDGAIQGLCELSRIPYVGNGILGSAISHNKAIAHILLNAADIRTPKWVSVSQRDLSHLERQCEKIELQIGYPVYVKPASGESAFGENAAQNRAELLTALKRAFTQDSTALVEQFVVGKELCVAVFGYDLPFASFVGEKVRRDDGTQDSVLVPADIEESTAAIVREIAIEAYRALECKGLALIDFHYAERGDILLDEVNTMPDLSEHAIYTTLMSDLGMRYAYLLDKLIEQAVEHSDQGF